MRFGDRKRDKKLYKQWEKYDGLPREATPKKEAPTNKKWSKHARLPREAIPQKEAPTGKKEAPTDRNGRRLNLLYILLGVSMLVFCAGLVLLLIQYC